MNRHKINTSKIHVHDRSLSKLGTGTLIKIDGLSWFYGHNPLVLMKIYGHANVFHFSKIPTLTYNWATRLEPILHNTDL